MIPFSIKKINSTSCVSFFYYLAIHRSAYTTIKFIVLYFVLIFSFYISFTNYSWLDVFIYPSSCYPLYISVKPFFLFLYSLFQFFSFLSLHIIFESLPCVAFKTKELGSFSKFISSTES